MNPKKILRFERVYGYDPVRRGEEGHKYYEIDGGIYRLKFPHKGLMKLVVAPAENAETSPNKGFVKFCENNIVDSISSQKDVKNASGTSLSLETWIPVDGTEEFIFAGPTQMYSDRTNGPNFYHNLSSYKVRYALSNATIVSCELKNQIVRDYIGSYGYRSGNNIKQLILNDGSLAQKTSDGIYTPIATRGTVNRTNLGLFRDSCIKTVNG